MRVLPAENRSVPALVLPQDEVRLVWQSAPVAGTGGRLSWVDSCLSAEEPFAWDGLARTAFWDGFFRGLLDAWDAVPPADPAWDDHNGPPFDRPHNRHSGWPAPILLTNRE